MDSKLGGYLMNDREIEKREQLIIKKINECIQIKKKLLGSNQIRIIVEVGKIISNIFKNGNKVILFGNGGSAADAQHIAAELTGRFYLDRIPLPAIALTTNSSLITAIANDYTFEMIFARQVEAIGEKGDVAVGISTSGDSINVIKAIKAARKKHMVTIGLTGRDGGQLSDIVDYCIQIPSSDTPRIQEGHIMIGHIICEIVEKELFASR